MQEIFINHKRITKQDFLNKTVGFELLIMI